MISPWPSKNPTSKEKHRFFRSETWRWTQKILLFLILCLLVNYLSSRESFPGSNSYKFPMEGFLASLALCFIIGSIAELNFRYYKRRHFSRKVEIKSITWYLLSTIGYITIMYIPISIILNRIAGTETEFYYLILGLLITLLISFVLISLSYALDIYNLYKLSLKDAEITIERGRRTTILSYENIACFYSKGKIVYTVKTDGSTISTDFTLNELEEKINDQLFFRANRQIIVHRDAIGQTEKIENGKLRIILKTVVHNEAIRAIIVSRYKRKAFINWFQ